MKKIKTVNYPNSIGFLWEKFSSFLGFSVYDASKVMGLASYGNPNTFYKKMRNIVSFEKEGEFTTDVNVLRFRWVNDYSELEKLFGVKHITHSNERTKKHVDLAASLQKVTNDVLIHIGKYLTQFTKLKNLCMAGGVALNCTANYQLFKSGYFKNIYIQPAAHDGGTALGAAYHIWNNNLLEKRNFVMNHAYWGISYSENEIESVLKKEKLQYKKVKNIEYQTAKLLSSGNIIGWFQGKIEWGPRALGNRTLLADPRNQHMKDILNERIKKREPFRPFAPSVLKEKVDTWFDIPRNCSSLSMDFMEFAFPVKKQKQRIIPAVTHIDGTSRIQTVDKQTNPKYHKMISEFGKITGVPLVLNTSFNENEPIVCSPLDAIKTFKRTKMDYLAIGNFLVSKKGTRRKQSRGPKT